MKAISYLLKSDFRNFLIHETPIKLVSIQEISYDYEENVTTTVKDKLERIPLTLRDRGVSKPLKP